MNVVKKSLLIAALICSPYFIDSAFAQVPPTAGTIGPSGCFPPPCVPIDGGLSLLIAAGLGIAGKKAFDFSKEPKDQ